MAGTLVKFGPTALTTGAADAFTPAAATIRTVVRGIHIVNKTAGEITISMFIGATGGSAAGTEFECSAKKIPANQSYNWYGALVLSNTQFLTWLASANTSAVGTITAEQIVVG